MNKIINLILGLTLLTLASCGTFCQKKKCDGTKQCPYKTGKECKGKKCDGKKQCPKSQKKCDKKKQCPLKSKAKSSAFAPSVKKTFGNLTSLTTVKWLDFTSAPNKKTAEQFKAKGYKVVINLLAPSEIKFDEKAVVKKQGIIYHNIPLLVNGEIDKAAVAKIHDVVAKHKGQKTLMHCSSGNRTAGWFGAHMYLDHKFSKELSFELAKNGGMTKVKMQKKLQAFFSKN